MHSRLFQTIIVTFAAIVTVSATDIFLPSLPALAVYFKVTEEAVQLSLPACLLGSLIGSPILGSLSDHYGRRPLLLFGVAVFFFGSIACAYSPTLPIFLAARFIQGVGAVASFVIGWAIIQELYPKDESAKIMSWLGSIVGTAPLIAPVFGGYLHVTFGWRANFLFISFLTGVIVFLICLSRPKERPPAHTQALSLLALLKNYLIIIKDKVFFLYLSLFAFLMCGQWCYLTVIPFYFENKLLLSPDIFGLYLSAAASFYIMGTFIAPAVIARMGIEKTILFSIFLAIVGSTGLFFVSLFVPTLPALITFTVGLYFLGMGLVWGPTTSRAFQRFETMRGAASAVRGLLLTTFFAMGSFIGSLLDDSSLVSLALFLMGMAFLCFFNFLKIKKLEG